MRLVPETSPWPRLLVFPFGIMSVLGLFAVLFRSDLVLRLAHCPLRDLTGLACPTCGGTQATVALVQGNLSAAVVYNPLVTGGLAVFGIWLVIGLIATFVPRLRRVVVWTPREKRTARVLAVLLFLLTWIWEIRRCGI